MPEQDCTSIPVSAEVSVTPLLPVTTCRGLSSTLCDLHIISLTGLPLVLIIDRSTSRYRTCPDCVGANEE